jgi:hypothetical protein
MDDTAIDGSHVRALKGETMSVLHLSIVRVLAPSTM